MIVSAALTAALGHMCYALAFSSRGAAAVYARIGRWITGGVGIFFGVLGITLLVNAAAAFR